ncbi:MAG TPA: M56 family metallopeptidase [Chryseolinea sp.]|nr:M56 family metallopeptidase [Chryseolinea sp.]
MMNTIFEFFNSPVLDAIGYTLIHSLWQSCGVFAVIIFMLRLIPAKLSNTRYAVASIGLITVFALSIGTFFYLYSPTNTVSGIAERAASDHPFTLISAQSIPKIGYYFNAVKSFIHHNIPLFLIIWACGALIFSLRIITGLLYVERIREHSRLVTGDWINRIQELAVQLKIERWISLAESSLIQSPIVIGYFKPMILIPLGMLANLSTEQVETIFLHELMHIRRKDYLINLIQSVIEAIFFFNPIVWIISGLMRREREHCCDDAVIKFNGNVRAYAFALASLEESRLSEPGLAISLGKNKNQLLNRIKRLMEKSVKTYSGRERMLPALLLVMGLICASWITIQTGRREASPIYTSKQTVVSDTTKKDKKQRKSRKGTDMSKETANQKDKTSDIEVVEKSEEYDTKVAPAPLPDFHFDMPPIPDVAAMIPPVPDINIMLDEFDFPAMPWRGEEDWEEFGKEFEEKFKAKFGDFYQANEEDIQRIIEDVQQKVNSKFDEDWAKKMQDFAVRQQELARTHAENWERQKDVLSREQEHLKNSEDDVKRWEKEQASHLKEFEKNHEQFERKMKAFEENTQRFEEELKTELIKDGYLGENEKLTNMHWYNGSIEINGKKIKPSDEKKYNELHEKFSQTNSN